ncbi:hypothetical protein [Glycomyces sp. YM15]|uniref:hypothetical protein n=1 Tax=Glycomyces sp. YM15 TaxID=2800446 RepID=UPI001962BEE3|nr:hypothetical protein [Glycomyces sp. YM15]
MGLKRHDYTSTTGKAWHAYYLDGRQVPGVTTILDKTLAKPSLIDWAAAKVAEAAFDAWEAYEHTGDVTSLFATADELAAVPEQYKRAAAARGTRVHHAAEKFLRHGTGGIAAPDIAGYMRAFLDWHREVQPVPVLIEQSVANRTWRYAGTVDLIADIDGVRTLLDFKTGRSLYVEVALQLDAYRNAEIYVDAAGDEQSVADLGIEAVQVLHLQDHGGWHVYDLNAGPIVWQVMQHLVWLYHQMKTVQKADWIGAPVRSGFAAEVEA